jgi:dTDP-4-dehydrorhamnose reductase
VNKKVLVLGSTGMLGHQVVHYLQKYSDYRIYDIAYRQKLREDTIIFDITQKEAFETLLHEIKPDYIINCVGILINGSKDVEKAIYINAYLPHQLKRVADSLNAKLIHISTDCVFSGKKGNYKEADERDGTDIYARTKILGEIIDSKHLTLRTSIIGPELKERGEGLFHWFMMQTGEINGFTQAIWSGVTTLELAKAIYWAIENDISGLYHVTNNQTINKYDLLNLFKKHIKKDIVIHKVDGKAVNKSFRDTRRELNYVIPSYDVMIKEMVESILDSPTLYLQYNLKG